MAEARPPPQSVIGIIVGEQLIFRIHGHVEVIAGSGGIDLHIGAIGAEAHDAPAVDRGFGVVDVAFGVVDAFVTGADIEIAIHPQSNVGGNVIVETVTVDIGRGIIGIDQILAIDADTVFIGEHAELGGVMDVQFAVHVLQAEDGIETFGKDGDFAIGVNDEDAIGGIFAGTFLIHRIFGQKDSAIRRGEYDGGMMNRRFFGEDFELPVVGEFPGVFILLLFDRLGRSGFCRRLRLGFFRAPHGGHPQWHRANSCETKHFESM